MLDADALTKGILSNEGWANAGNVSFETLNGGRVTLSTELIILNYFNITDVFLYHSILSARYCIDISRRNSLLVTHGS